MVKGKKSFIDRKKAVTFQLVHRSQHDPLVVDNTAPQRVLVEAIPQNQQPKQDVDKLDPTKRHEEQQKYGVFFDDDYNYLQHLKQPEQDIAWEYLENPNHSRKRIEEGSNSVASKITLPSSVFASDFEEAEGVLNKAAPCPGPRPDWDPDVVAALDDDFDHEKEENILDDDFVLKAMVMGTNDEDDVNEVSLDTDISLESDNDSELIDRLGPLMHDGCFYDEETKSRFTEYSISSNVIRRNENLTFLDDRFDRFYASYDEPELGDLACEEIEGIWHQKHPVVLKCYKEQTKGNKLDEYNKEWDRERIEKYRDVAEGDKDPNDEIVELEMCGTNKKKCDCESILSTYSNIYNHPKLIEEPCHRSSKPCKDQFVNDSNKIEIDLKSGMPMNVLRNTDGLTIKAVARLDDEASCSGQKSLCNKSLISTLSVLSIRPKNESHEEKRERKRLLKEYRNERRIEKKANSDAFKQEHKRQAIVKINQKCNQQGSKIL